VDSFEQLAGADARKVILFLAVMAVHAVGEGGGVGVSFAGDRGWAQVSWGLRTVCSFKGGSSRKTIAAAALHEQHLTAWQVVQLSKGQSSLHMLGPVWTFLCDQ
jgi:hypothetical protein